MRHLAALALPLALASAAHAQDVTCTTDVRLTEAAALLALEHEPSEDTLMRIVRAAGSETPRAHALSIAEGDEGRLAEWLTSLVERGETPLACGEARVGERRVVIAAPAAATLEVDGTRVRGHLAIGWSEPLLYAEDASGEIEVMELTSPSFDTSLPSDVEAVRVQIVARGPDGPRPVAERVLGEREAPVGGSSDDPRERVERLRRDAGVSAMRPNRLLDLLAAEHAESVCDAGEVAHELEPGRDPSARLREDGVTARHVGEVVARGVDTAHAVGALATSPSHHAALIDARFTDVGIGTADDAEGRSCVVVILTAWPRILARTGAH